MKKSYAIKPAQKMHLNLYLEAPNEIYCNDPLLFVLNSDIDLNRMKNTVNKIMANHPALRTKIFIDEHDEYKQTYEEKFFVSITITKLTD